MDLHDIPLADTSDMLAVHAGFREAFATAPVRIGTIPHGDAARTELIAAYYRHILAFLVVHHQSEDEILWPLLAERLPQADAARVREIAAQHEGLHGALESAFEALAAWTVQPDEVNATALVDALAELEVPLLSHLGQEEAEVLPLAAQVITAPEWGMMPAHGMAHLPPQSMFLALGLIRENLDEAQRDHMLANMPPPAVEFWTTVGEPTFVDFMAQVRR